MNLNGLTTHEVAVRTAKGQINQTNDSYSPGYLKIVLANIFSVINIVITPLLVFLFILGLREEVLAFAVFLVFNTITSLFDEIRIKREIAKLKSQFQTRAGVIRNGKLVELPINEIVINDLIKAVEGDTIAADGKILEAKYLQLDESNLTGESDFLKKDAKEQVFAGSFVVTGECYYQVTEVGSNSYTNKLASASTKFAKVKSEMQVNSDKLIAVLIFLAIAIGAVNFIMTGFNTSLDLKTRVLSVMSVSALTIPQTLIFLFTLTFSISIFKLFKKGVLVQKGAAIENLTNIDVICLDKTGTITTNQMLMSDSVFFNLTKEKLGAIYSSTSDFLFGVSKTQRLINDSLPKDQSFIVNDFDQVPFTSHNKYSLISGKLATPKGNDEFTVLLGAFEVIKHRLDRDLEKKITKQVTAAEALGKRAIVAIYFNKCFKKLEDIKGISNSAVFYSFEEELNLGISKILSGFQELGIKVKVISGDSKGSVETIVKKVGLDKLKILDISTLGENGLDEEKILNNDIFTRAKPEDKLNIINTLKAHGLHVAMVGDGINDVLSLKAANVSIAMESGAKVTRSIADIVLLKNDYQKLPAIFYEGDNIIFNLKLSTQMFLAKSVFALIMGLAFSILLLPFPIHPSTTLIFSFLSSSLPGYILIFTRSKVKNSKNFFKDIYFSAIPAGVIISVVSLLSYYLLFTKNLDAIQLNTALMLVVLASSTIYSLFLLWNSKKIKNIAFLLFAFVLTYEAGMLQTILPLSWEEIVAFWPNILVSLLIISLTILYLGFKFGKPETISKKLLYIIGAFAWYPVLLFPFRSYFHADTLACFYYFSILVTGTVFLLLITKAKSLLLKVFTRRG